MVKRVHSEETKRKISETLKRKHREGILVAPWKGKQFPEWYKQKLSKAQSYPEGSTRIQEGYRMIKFKGKYIAEQIYVWLRYSDWKFIPKGFEIHHRNLNKLDNKIDNLICLPCDIHVKAHWFYEKKNNISRFNKVGI